MKKVRLAQDNPASTGRTRILGAGLLAGQWRKSAAHGKAVPYEVTSWHLSVPLKAVPLAKQWHSNCKEREGCPHSVQVEPKTQRMEQSKDQLVVTLSRHPGHWAPVSWAFSSALFMLLLTQADALRLQSLGRRIKGQHSAAFPRQKYPNGNPFTSWGSRSSLTTL